MSAAATPPTINGSISPALHMPPVFIPLDECVRLADAGDAEAQFQLGLRYKLGRQVEQSNDKAARYWTLAAKERSRAGARPLPGHVDAQCLLAVHLETAPFVSAMDRARSLELYTQAQRQGHIDATLNLSDIYREGRGVKADYIYADRLRHEASALVAERTEAKRVRDAAAAVEAVERAKREDDERRARGGGGGGSGVLDW